MFGKRDRAASACQPQGVGFAPCPTNPFGAVRFPDIFQKAIRSEHGGGAEAERLAAVIKAETWLDTVPNLEAALTAPNFAA